MYKIPDEAQAIAVRLNATHRIVHRGATMKKVNGEMVVDVPGAITAVIIDKTLNKEYCQEEGDDEPDAIVKAYRKAVTADKPMTPAQQASAGQVSTAKASEAAARAELDKTQTELETLKAELATAQAALAASGKKTKTKEPPEA